MAVDNWTSVEWAAYYKAYNHTTGELIQGYGREYFARGAPGRDHLTPFRHRWAKLVEYFGIQPADRVLVIGCAFGYLMDAAHEAGYPNVWGVDSSPDVAARKGVEASGTSIIIEEDIRGLGGRIRNILRSQTGDDVFAWVITEDVVGCYNVDDSEGANKNVLNLAPLLETLLDTGRPSTAVIHIVSPARAPGWVSSNNLTMLTLAEWKALIPTHSWMTMLGEETL